MAKFPTLCGRIVLILSVVIVSVGIATDNAHSQVTNNVLLRVLHIQTRSAAGTAFTLDVDGRQYVITAKHLVAGLKPEDTVKIFRDGRWSSLTVKVFRCDDPIDIAVLIPPFQITVSLPLSGSVGGMLFGQESYFLGFPYGKYFSDAKGLNTPFPVPFIKHAVTSAVVQENGATVFYLDGHNNPGFSGGPVVYRDLNERTQTPVYRVLAVVSGFEPDVGSVFDLEEIKRDAITPADREQGRIAESSDGKVFRLKDTSHVIRGNSGIVKSYSIKHALDVIAKNPIGPDIK